MNALRPLMRWPWYPWIFALYPIIHLFAQNITLIRENEVGQAAIVVLIVTTALYLAVLALVRHRHATALVILAFQVAFFTYGPLYEVLNRAGQRVLMPVMIAAALGITAWALRHRNESARLNGSLTVVTLVLLLFPLWTVITHYTRLSTSSLVDNMVILERATTPRVINDAAHPDIYYIILDGYPSNAFLQRHNGYDNRAFTDALEERGFFVAYDSTSNYGKTFASLASSLNMRYIDPAEKPPVPDANPYLWSLTANNLVAQTLQAQYGYTYVLLLSGYSVPSTLADLNMEFYPDRIESFSGDKVNLREDGSWHYKQPFWPLLLQTTALRRFVSRAQLELFAAELYFWQEGLPYSWRSAERARAVYDALETIPHMPEATFTFAHIMKPHEPVRFDRQGNTIDDNVVMQDVEFYFFEQLDYINTRTLALIDSILERSEVPPIIILQGDHGSNLGEGQDPDGTWKYFDILNAYYFPDRGTDALRRDITPVNTFRTLFNTYFDASYALLPDRHFDIPKGLDDMFFYVEIVEDGRLNVGLGDNVILLYPRVSEADEAAINVFSVDDQGGPGDLLFTLTQTDVVPYLSSSLDQNLPIRSTGPVEVYALTSGEIQFNIGPDSAGDVWAVIIDNIPAKIIYGYKVNG